MRSDARTAEAPALRWLWLAAALLTVFAVGTASAGLNLALPRIAFELHATTTQLTWFLAATLLAFAVLVVPGAFAGDLLGHARVHLAGAACFTLSSVLAALAASPGALLVARLGQGAGAALMVPQAVGYARAHLTRAGQALVYGLFALGYVAGPPLGTLLARVLLDPLGLSWRAVFWVSVPLGLVALAATVPLLWQPVPVRFDPMALLVAFLAMLGALGTGYPVVVSSLPHLTPGHAAMLVTGLLLLAGALAVDTARRGVRLGLGAPLLVLLAVAGAGQVTAVDVFEQAVAGRSGGAQTLLASGLALGALAGGLLAVPLVRTVDSRVLAALGSAVSGFAAVGELLLVREVGPDAALPAFGGCLVASGLGLTLALAALLRGDATGPGPVFAMLPLGAMGGAVLFELATSARPPTGDSAAALAGAWRDIVGFALAGSIALLAIGAVLARWLAPTGPAATGAAVAVPAPGEQQVPAWVE
jgi:MFS family permease